MDYRIRIEDVFEEFLGQQETRNNETVNEDEDQTQNNQHNQQELDNITLVSQIDFEKQEQIVIWNNIEIQPIDTLKIYRKKKLNSQVQPHQYSRNFSLVLFTGFSYALWYLTLLVFINILLLSSKDFRSILNHDNDCPSEFSVVLILIETLCSFNCILGYSIIFYMSQKRRQKIEIYKFSGIRIRLLTVHSKIVKSLIIFMDILHLIFSIYVSSVANANPEGLQVCWEQLHALYITSYIITILGYISIIRMLYLLFPHLLGYKFFQYKQMQNKMRQQDINEEKDLKIYNYCDYFKNKLGYKNCIKCQLEFNNDDNVVSMGCLENHIMHRNYLETQTNFREDGDEEIQPRTSTQKNTTAAKRTTLQIKRVISTKNHYYAPKHSYDLSIKSYLRFFYFWPSIVYVAVNIVGFEVGFQLIDIGKYPDAQPLSVISTISCFGPIFNMLLSIMIYWNTFRSTMLYTKTYSYDKGRSILKLTSFKKFYFNYLIALIDVYQITIASVAAIYASIFYENLMYLKDNFAFGYYFYIIQIFVGLLCIIRLFVLIFPHMLGHHFFQWRQDRDNLVYSKQTAKNLLVFDYGEYQADVMSDDHYYQSKFESQPDFKPFFTQCKVCNLKFTQTDEIVELVCTGEHIIHKMCADDWFNNQKHINCPVCLEFILGQQNRPLSLARTPGNSHYTK
eukprot:403357283